MIKIRCNNGAINFGPASRRGIDFAAALQNSVSPTGVTSCCPPGNPNSWSEPWNLFGQPSPLVVNVIRYSSFLEGIGKNLFCGFNNSRHYCVNAIATHLREISVSVEVVTRMIRHSLPFQLQHVKRRILFRKRVKMSGRPIQTDRRDSIRAVIGFHERIGFKSHYFGYAVGAHFLREGKGICYRIGRVGAATGCAYEFYIVCQ
jgi:hypothetical protein